MALHRVIISGGGTGGHIFPAIAIANAIKARYPDCRILFVGAKGKMEMTRVPEAGYEIRGLDIAGLQRKFDFRNFLLPFKLYRSMRQAREILREFRPMLVIGVGGYASGPMLFAAQRNGIPTLIQEQNSYAGLTNKILAKKAKAICVAYPGMDTYFPADRLVMTGNPVRSEMLEIRGKREEARKFFGLSPSGPVVLAIGGSLGAGSINRALHAQLNDFARAGVQLIWQTGKRYSSLVEGLKADGVVIHPFIQRMDLAYAAADVIISRAGALSISELCLVGKPCILVPSPNVAEDHQTKNALVLVNAKAALMVTDHEAGVHLVEEALTLLRKKEKCVELGANIRKLAIADASTRIMEVAERISNA